MTLLGVPSRAALSCWAQEHSLSLGRPCNAIAYTSAGVKLVLPAILTGVDDIAWRTKQGSVEPLGTGAFPVTRQTS